MNEGDQRMMQEILRKSKITKLTRMKVLLHYLEDAAMDYGLGYEHRYYTEVSAEVKKIAEMVDDDLEALEAD